MFKDRNFTSNFLLIVGKNNWSVASNEKVRLDCAQCAALPLIVAPLALAWDLGNVMSWTDFQFLQLKIIACYSLMAKIYHLSWCNKIKIWALFHGGKPNSTGMQLIHHLNIVQKIFEWCIDSEPWKCNKTLQKWFIVHVVYKSLSEIHL